MKKEQDENKYEVIIPERRYIVIGLKEVKKILDEYKPEGVCIKLRREENE